MTARKPCIGLVVPALEQGGGVPSVAEFVCQALERSSTFEYRLISLSVSARDDISVSLTQFSSWLRGVCTRNEVWRGRPFTRVGAFLSELEFQRYQPRTKLAEILADCDLIQVVCGSPAWANAVIGLGKPVALQVATRARVERRRRDAQPRSVAAWWRKAMTAITDRLDDRALQAVDAIQLENLWMLDYARHINRQRNDIDIRYAPPGVDARLFHPLAEREFANPPYILCVGRLDDPRKNISLLLDAFCQLPANLSFVQLVTAGSAPPPPAYWARATSLGLQDRVRHVARPATDELVRLYQRALVFALPSDEEGLGVVILEAMACGVPVVVTRCGGPDGIITDGQDGFLVPLDDAATMAERLTRLCLDTALNRRLGRQARATIEARYAEEVTGMAFLDTWEQLLRKSGKR